jgi:NADH dehydrogenase [ubiquinone] 1 alpha subcomplex assembly factor 7
MTNLADRLRQQIQDQGPMRLSQFMGEAVSHYYASRDPFGQGGDFITAPEISQMFGEIIGLWAAVIWQMLGSPDRILLAELGPGRGTLMVDLLRAAGMLPGFKEALDVHLVETSPALRQRQQAILGEANWIDSLDQLPDGPAIIIANEFIDALPIDQYIYREDGWHQRLVAGEFEFVDGGKVDGAGFPAAEPGDIFEVNEAGRAVAAALGARFAKHPGAALLIDYGHAVSACGDTLQALGSHQSVPALSTPGEVDLTAHVDFQALAEAAKGAIASPVVTQGAFLRRLGIELRAARLGKQGDCARLINPHGMGTLFKVLALSSAGLTDLPGMTQ